MYKYEYTGDGTHHFTTLGWQPQPGDTIEVDEPLNNSLLREITAQTEPDMASEEVLVAEDQTHDQQENAVSAEVEEQQTAPVGEVAEEDEHHDDE